MLTLLVISFDEIPSNFTEILAAVKRIPGFAASFAVLMMFWLQHRLWSRWYGLENSRTILYSLALIFVMLVYVYPLRMIFEGLFSGILFRIAMQNSKSLGLNQVEQQRSRNHVHTWAIAAGFGALSILLALTLPNDWVQVAGHMYFILIPAMQVPRYLDRRRKKSLAP